MIANIIIIAITITILSQEKVYCFFHAIFTIYFY